MVRVVELSWEWEAPWDEFVAAHPAGLLYHSLRFRSFLTHLLGCESRYALAVRDGAVVGAMPLLVADGPHEQVVNSLAYFGSPGGILAGDDEARAALAEWYEAQITADGVAAATAIGNPLDPDARPLLHDISDARVCHVTDLSEIRPLLEAVEPSARRNVAKAAREGIEVATDNREFAALAGLHQRGMEALGGVAKSDAFFAAVPLHFRPGADFQLYVARLNGRVVAALLLFYFGDTVEYYVPATDLEHRSLQPLGAILARAMADAQQRGSRTWNWGGSWPSQKSLMRFKTKWGGQPRPYSYWIKVNSVAVTRAAPRALLDAYPGFYVRPFEAGAPLERVAS